MKYNNTILGALVAAVLVSGAGCGSSTPSRHYTLSTVRNVTGDEQRDTAFSFAIGIRTLKLPEYLLRQQLVKRSGNTIVIHEFDRWGESLDANFKRVLLEDLSADIPTNNIFLFPARDSSVVNYQLLLEVSEFEFVDGEVVLSVRWGLEKGESIAFLMDKRSSFRERSGESFSEIVAVMSRLIGKLSREIADEVRGRALSGR